VPAHFSNELASLVMLVQHHTERAAVHWYAGLHQLREKHLLFFAMMTTISKTTNQLSQDHQEILRALGILANVFKHSRRFGNPRPF
jgi:predicted 2-oxoglutarate/Fe(II)-dependent dioxygenase YbiX